MSTPLGSFSDGCRKVLTLDPDPSAERPNTGLFKFDVARTRLYLPLPHLLQCPEPAWSSSSDSKVTTAISPTSISGSGEPRSGCNLGSSAWSLLRG